MRSNPKLRGLIGGLALATAVAVSAGAAPKLLTKTDGIVRHDIDVTTVDPTAVQAANRWTGAPNKNVVVVPQAAARKGKLFLYIVGSGISTTTDQELLYEGARRGYNGIAIAYRNYEAVVPLCAHSSDDDCMGKVREEILTGQDLSPLVDVKPKDALEPRLQKTLAYLAATYPGEGWGEFLKGGEIDWSRIVTAGHSQGAGHVALLAKRHALARAVIISGTADFTTEGKPAAWLSRPNVTPPDRQYGFTNVDDQTVRLPMAEATWKIIGLQGPITSVDGKAPPYDGSHMLTTAVQPTGRNVHVGMVDDDTMARNGDGVPVHTPVWDLTIFP